MDSDENHNAARLLKAVDYAAKQHQNQRRKGPSAHPYINHPVQVAHILAGEGGITDTDTLCAAILHDTIEDTDTTEEMLTQHFGSRVAGIVVEVTDDKTLPKAERKALQITHSPHLSPAAKAIKLADKLSNVRDIRVDPPDGWSRERRLEYLDWATAVVDGLRGVNPNLEAQFDNVVHETRGAIQ